MHEIVRVMGFPPDFRKLLKTIYKEMPYRAKVNGIVGSRKKAKNSVRQGCPLSPLASSSMSFAK